MLDKLYLRTHKKLDENWDNAFYTDYSTEKMRGSSSYNSCTIVKKKKDHVLTVLSNPRKGFSGVWPITLQLNPSKWESFSDLKQFLEMIVDVESLIISRVDSAVDLNMNLEEVLMQLRIKYKRRNTSYDDSTDFIGGECRGVYYGGEPELFCIYDKGYQLGHKHKYRKISGAPLGEKTRIEVRHTKEKIRVERFCDLSELADHSPFESVETLKLKDSAVGKKRYLEVERNIKYLYMQKAYARLNQNNNFRRDFGAYFEDSGLKNEIDGIYFHDLKVFFGL